jgi:mannose-6-phosphate isomerase class I
VRELGPGSWQDELVGPAQTDCFRVARTTLNGPALKDETSCVIAIVTQGEVTLTAHGESHRLRRYDKVFLPAALGPVAFAPAASAEILECFPPAA